MIKNASLQTLTSNTIVIHKVNDSFTEMFNFYFGNTENHISYWPFTNKPKEMQHNDHTISIKPYLNIYYTYVYKQFK